MERSLKGLVPVPVRPPHYTLVDGLAWLLCGWALLYALLLPPLATWVVPVPDFFAYAPLLTLVGTAVILLSTLRQAHPAHPRHYRLACLALLLTQVLNNSTMLLWIMPYEFGETPRFAAGISIYILAYLSLIASIGLVVPFWTFPRSTVWRVTLDTTLIMALTDVGLHVLLPVLVPGWQWTPPLLLSAFRLESTLGLLVWFTRLFHRFGDRATVPTGLWQLGFVCLLLRDGVVLWTTFLLYQGVYAMWAATPFLMLTLTLWALAFYRTRTTPIAWRHNARFPTASPPLWQQLLQSTLTLVAVAVVVTIAASAIGVIWFVGALISRELLTIYERERVRMAERQAREALAATNDALATANAQLRHTQAELATVNERLAAANQRQAQLLTQRQLTTAEVAHDMGNALQEVWLALTRMQATLPQLPPAVAATMQAHIARADAAVEVNASLLSAMVAAAQLDAGALQLTLRPVASADLIRRVVQQHQARAAERAVRVRLELAAALPPMQGDAALIARALTNIVGNALKYTGAARNDGSGQVTVTASGEAGQVRITVTDNGPGIPPEQLARLGQRFVRGVDDPAAPAGVGLGLAFARGVIEAHPGGAFSLASTLGVGTQVVMSVPAAPPDAPTD